MGRPGIKLCLLAPPGDADKGLMASPGDANKGLLATPGDADKGLLAPPGDANKGLLAPSSESFLWRTDLLTSIDAQDAKASKKGS